MTKVIFSEGGRKIRTKSLDEYNFTLSKQARETFVSGEISNEETIADCVYKTYTPAVSILEEDVIVNETTINNDVKEYISSNTNIATVNQSGVVTRVANGTVDIVVKGKYLSRSINVTVNQGEDDEVTFFDRYAAGSLSRDVSDTIDTRIAGKSASTAMRVFSTQNHASSQYVRSVNFWGADLDFTCVSPWNSSGGANKAGTLISPRHIVFATHYQIGVGSTIRFVTNGNVVVERTMTAKISIPNGDFTIGVLNSDVPETITFAKVMPDTWAQYAPTIENRIPVVRFDQEEKAMIGDIVTVYDASEQGFYSAVPSKAKRLEFYEDIVGGDSGNPCLILINEEPVILSVWTNGGSGSGYNIAYYKSAINSAMTTLGGGYQLTEVDLSSFIDY